MKLILEETSTYKYWLTYGDWEGSRSIIKFNKACSEKQAADYAKNNRIGQENIVGIASFEEAKKKADEMEERRAAFYGGKEDTKIVVAKEA